MIIFLVEPDVMLPGNPTSSHELNVGFVSINNYIITLSILSASDFNFILHPFLRLKSTDVSTTLL